MDGWVGSVCCSEPNDKRPEYARRPTVSTPLALTTIGGGGGGIGTIGDKESGLAGKKVLPSVTKQMPTVNGGKGPIGQPIGDRGGGIHLPWGGGGDSSPLSAPPTPSKGAPENQPRKAYGNASCAPQERTLQAPQGKGN